MTMLPFAFNIRTSGMNEMQFFIHWQKEKDWQSRETCSESSLANKATERARQLEVRSKINGSFKDVVVALLYSEKLVERGQCDQNMVRVKCKSLDSMNNLDSSN